MRITKSKLNTKVLGCEPMSVWATENGPASVQSGCDMPMARFFGVITGLRPTESGFHPGEFENALVGQFQGINLQTGQCFPPDVPASVLYLPDLARAHAEALFAAAGGQPTKLDVTLYAERALKQDKSFGYQWVLQSGDDEGAVSVLDDLREKALAEFANGTTPGAAKSVSQRASVKALPAASKAKPKAK